MGTTSPDRRAWLSVAGRMLPAVVAGVLAAVLTAALLLAGVVPALTGARPVAVDTASDRSELAAGALVIVRHETPVVGDVIAVASGPDGVRMLGVVTAVDAAGTHVVSSADGGGTTVRTEDVEGVYLYGVPWLGALWSGVSTPSGMFFVAALLLMLVAGHHIRLARHSGSSRSGREGVSVL